MWDWRKQPNSCDLRAQELSSATKDSDGRKQAALRKLLAHNTTGSATEAVGTRYDRQRYGSCWRAIRPAALQKLLARDTTGSATEAVGARDDRQFLRDQKRFVIKASSQRFSRGHSFS